MTQRETKPRDTGLAARLLKWTRIILLTVLILGLFTTGQFLSVAGMITYGTLIGLVLLSTLLRWGWLVPCAIWGLVLVIISHPRTKGGVPEWQSIQTIGYIIGGAIAGAIFGLLIDSGLKKLR